MLRTHIGLGDDIGAHSEELIKAGKLVPDELVNELVENRLKEPDARQGVILDGYPRTINQASVLLHLLDEERVSRGCGTLDGRLRKNCSSPERSSAVPRLWNPL